VLSPVLVSHHWQNHNRYLLDLYSVPESDSTYNSVGLSKLVTYKLPLAESKAISAEALPTGMGLPSTLLATRQDITGPIPSYYLPTASYENLIEKVSELYGIKAGQRPRLPPSAEFL
jgi:hypothetical protein